MNNLHDDLLFVMEEKSLSPANSYRKFKLHTIQRIGYLNVC